MASQLASYIFSILYKLIHKFIQDRKPCNTQNVQRTKYSVSWTLRTKRVSTLIYCKLSKISLDFLFSDLIINLKQTFNIPFRITPKTTIMGTSSQFHDGTQLKFYQHLAQRYCTFGVGSRNLCQDLELLNNNGNLTMCNLTKFLRLTLIQYDIQFICCTSSLLTSGVNTPLILRNKKKLRELSQKGKKKLRSQKIC